MRHGTRGSTAAGNRPGTEERIRYAERRGAREAGPNLAIDPAVRRRDYFRFDAGCAVGPAARPSGPTLSSMYPLASLVENSKVSVYALWFLGN